MKKTKSLFALMVGLQLIFISIAGANECPEGQYFNNATGRCLITTQTANIKDHSNRCGNLSGQEYQDCYLENVKDQVSELEESEKITTNDGLGKGNLHRAGVPLTVGLIAGYYLIKKKSSFKNCQTASIWIMVSAAAAGAITELAAQANYAIQTRKLVKKYEDQIKSNEEGDLEGAEKATEAQTYALELMKEQEEARKLASTIRKKGHLAAAGLYGAASVAAMVEQFMTGLKPGACLSANNGGPSSIDAEFISKNDSFVKENMIDIQTLFLDPEFKEEFKEYAYLDMVSVEELYEMIKRKVFNNLFVGAAIAQDQTSEGSGIDFASVPNITISDSTPENFAPGEFKPVEISEAIEKSTKTPFGKKITNLVDKSLSTPWVRASLAGALGFYAYKLHDNAKENEQIANKRMEAIDQILISYRDSGGAFIRHCSEEQSANPGTPECYCYKDGKVNPQRKERAVCKSYMSNDFLAAKKYGGSGRSGYKPVKACLRDNGKVDEDCKVCKKNPERCPMLKSAHMGSLNMGGTQGIGEMAGQYNALASGKLSPTDLDSTRLGNQAARIKKMKNELAKKEPYKKAAQKIKNLEDQFIKAAPALYKKSFGEKGPQLASLGSFNPGAAAPAPLSEKNGDEDAKSKASSAKSSMGTGGSVAGAASKNSDDFDFGFGDSSEGGVVVDNSAGAEDIMDKNFAIKGDINKNPDTDIFKILSLRYQRSGLRRLFDTEGRSKADAPADTTINER